MVRYILKQWSRKKITMILIIIGFVIATLVLSVGISIYKYNIDNAYEKIDGEPDNQFEVDIHAYQNNKISIDVLEEIKKYGEIQISNSSTAFLNDYNNEYGIVSIWFNKEEKWHIPIKEGRYFKEKDLDENIKEVVLGKNIAQSKNINNGDKININDEEYVVIGICGRTEKTTKYDNLIYICISDFSDKNIEKYIKSEEQLIVSVKSGKKDFFENIDNVIELAKEKNNNIDAYSLENKSDNSVVKNTIIVTVISSIIIFSIALINIVNLMIYWIIERKKEFCVIKALGGTNNYIKKIVTMEVIFITVISAILAIIIQECVSFAFKDILISNEIFINITYRNYIISIGVAIICGFIASIVPAKQAIESSIVEVLSEE